MGLSGRVAAQQVFWGGYFPIPVLSKHELQPEATNANDVAPCIQHRIGDHPDVGSARKDSSDLILVKREKHSSTGLTLTERQLGIEHE